MRSKDHEALLCPDELPKFVRRCRHRASKITAFSEKMGMTVGYTTAVQDELSSLFEITHPVVSYEPWPGSVTVRAGWERWFEYWPTMATRSASGRRKLIDVVHPEDEVDRERMGFEAALHDALRDLDVELVTVERNRIAKGRTMRVAKEVRAHTALSDADLEEDLPQRLRAKGGRVSLGSLAGAEGTGRSLVATACVLVMRRELRLFINRDGFAASEVGLADDRAR